MNAKGKLCPSCGNDIGILSIVFAGLPSRIKCPHCKSQLKYRSTRFVFIVLVTIAIGLAIVLLTPVKSLAISPKLLEFVIYLFAFGVFWLPIELVFAIYLRAMGVLELSKLSKSD
jgi:hypothetical protein